ncbi:MAG: thioester domain-containing protein [Bacilli bacterium]|nr:thioester domain-containing protein [Bacilli bacterium]
MEKIYMDDHEEKKQSKFRQIMGSQVPHHLSALMILVAFVSFIAIQFGGKESHAIMYDKNQIGDTFKTITSAHSEWRTIKTNDSTVTGPYSLPHMLIDEGAGTASNKQVFCLDKDKEFPTDETNAVTYTRTANKVDAGIVYIISQNDNHYNSNGQLLNKYTRTWITQTAIWAYKGALGDDKAKAEAANLIRAYKYGTSGLEKTDEETVQDLYAKYVTPLVSKAATVKDNNITITKSSDDITVTSDNKYYKSPMITVGGIQSGETYSMSSEVPSGTKWYRENGTEIKDLAHIDVTKFYMLVPIANVTEKTKTVKLSVTGPVPTAYEFTPSDANVQKVTVLEKQTMNTGLDLNYAPSVPDTGMNAAQSVYFIGLVILLCGLGIIYANAKSKVSE